MNGSHLQNLVYIAHKLLNSKKFCLSHHRQSNDRDTGLCHRVVFICMYIYGRLIKVAI